jgi:hypothetical protein
MRELCYEVSSRQLSPQVSLKFRRSIRWEYLKEEDFIENLIQLLETQLLVRELAL